MKARFCVHYFALFAMVATIFPYTQVFLRARGFSNAEVGYLQGLMALAGVAGPIVVGHLADRFARRRLALLACLAAFIAVLGPLNATTNFAAAALLAMGLGLSGRTAIPLTDTLAANELPDPTHNYGRVRLWGSVGFVCTLLAIRQMGLVDESSSTSIMRAMLVGAAACLATSGFLPDRRRGHSGAPTPQAGGRHFDRLFWLFILVVALHRLGMSSYYFFFTNYLRDVLKLQQAAWVWAVGAAAEVPLLFCAGRIIRWMGIRWMLIVSMASITVRLAVYALVPSLAVILPVQLLHALTFGFCHAASIEFLRRKVPAQRRGLAMALYMSLALGLPNFIGSSIGGLVVEHWGYAVLYLLYAAPPVAGIACVVLAGRRLELKPPEA